MLTDNTNGLIKDRASLLLFMDGGCEPVNPGGSSTAGWALYDSSKPSGGVLAEQGEVVKDGGPLATNNFGEYAALALALKFLIAQKWQGCLTIKADSKLVVHQVRGEWKCNKEHLRELRDIVWSRMKALNLHIVTEDDPLPGDGQFPCNIVWVARNFNQRANDLCRAAYKQYVEKANGHGPDRPSPGPV
jgi:ribonuclease HI